MAARMVFFDENTQNVFLPYFDSFVCLLNKGMLQQLKISKSLLFMNKVLLFEAIFYGHLQKTTFLVT